MVEVTEVVAEGQAVRTLAVELDGRRARRRHRAGARPLRSREHQLPALAQGRRRHGRLRRRRAGLRGHRRRHQLGQVPHRGAARRTARGPRSSTAPRSRASGRASPRPATSPRRRSSGPSRRSPAWPTEARSNRASALVAVGTMGMRSAGNSDDFIARVRERRGVTIEVIPGEEEARLAYLAAVAGLGLTDGRRVVFDTGGGSTQFTFGGRPHRGRAVQRQRRRRAPHQRVRTRRRRSPGSGWTRRCAPSPASSAASTASRHRRRWSAWAAPSPT